MPTVQRIQRHSWPGNALDLINANFEALDGAVTNIVVNVKDYGAVGNGIHDDTDAINLAQAAIPLGGIVYFPVGTYLIRSPGLSISRSHVTFRGAGMFATTLTTTTASSMIQGTTAVRHIAFEDLGLDGQHLAGNGIVAYFVVKGLRVSRCRFYRLQTTALSFDNIADVDIEDCLLHSDGDGRGQGITLSRSCRNIRIRRSEFRWLASGVIIDTGVTTNRTEEVSENIVFEDNYVDLGWWLLTALFSGGASATYSSTVLTDTSAAFAGLSTFDTVRVMPVRATGVATFGGRTQLTCSGATFVSSGVRVGDIVRSGSIFACVLTVTSETVLWVEDWLSDTTRLPVDSPAEGAAFTVYGVYIGSIASFTATTITVARWYDFDGTAVTPASATHYEVTRHPNYAFNCEYSTRKLKVLNNTFRRGWSDQLSIFGYEAQVLGNLIEDGEDMGITIHGIRNVVSNNRIVHQGAGGIFSASTDSVFSNNSFANTPWTNPGVANGYLSHMIFYGAQKCVITGNRGDVGTSAFGRFGLVIYGPGPANIADANLVSNNYFTGHLVADIVVRGPNATNNKLWDNVGVVLIDQGATGTDQH